VPELEHFDVIGTNGPGSKIERQLRAESFRCAATNGRQDSSMSTGDLLCPLYAQTRRSLLTRLRAALHKGRAAAGSDRRSRSGDDLKRHRVIVGKNRHASPRSRRPL
jgi:hypothetical protein